ncbi:MAG: SusD/RagB family nutrient-binding outer membrane lipoprotein [Bacteroidales bacterium]|nr:SusD/RagB family nutrient-binding outer membrane lipoprotein [Bacteroidales bacterium]HPD95698.1 SusD/RagB family nutrient-binding outer membrane lipoprotein [Tenuifilaceae bacterium]
MFSVKKGLFLVAVIFAITGISCSKLEDENKDPNSISITEEHPDMLLTHSIEELGDLIFDVWLGHEIGSCWVQHMAKVQYTDEDRYVPRNDVINDIWTTLYAGPGIEIQRIIDIAKKNGHDNYQGVALVLKVYLFSVLTDLYGDIPYSEAFKPDSTLTPKYDTQESIYSNFMQALELANTLLKNDGQVVDGDILFDGDIVKWKRFANSLRLRLLLRMSNKMDAQSLKSAISSIVNNPTTYPIFQSNSDNAALHYLGTTPNNNPLNETYKTRDDHRVSKTLVDAMYNPNKPDHPDWRIMVYADVPDAGGYWTGLPNGLTSAKAAAYNGNGFTGTSRIGSYFIQPEAPGMFMSYAELQFLLAEVAYKDLLEGVSSADAQTFYENGIRASYYQFQDEILEKAPEFYSQFNGVVLNIDDFINDFLANDGAWNQVSGLQKIAKQKWIAMFDQGVQAWFEWRRTGLPVLVPAEDGLNNGKIPIRLRYPSDEYSRNEEQLNVALTRMSGSDDLNTPVWWNEH